MLAHTWLSMHKIWNSEQRTLETNNHSELAEYKVNVQKTTRFVCNSNAQMEFEIKDIVSLMLASPKMKYWHINLKKNVDLYEENYRLMKKIKELSKWSDSPCL